MREADLYAKAGYGFEQAHRLMCGKIRLPFCPPSFDVFKTELRALNAGAAERTTPQDLAQMICLRAKVKGHARP